MNLPNNLYEQEELNKQAAKIFEFKKPKRGSVLYEIPHFLPISNDEGGKFILLGDMAFDHSYDWAMLGVLRFHMKKIFDKDGWILKPGEITQLWIDYRNKYHHGKLIDTDWIKNK